jgi:hypothetical protein
MNLLTKLVITGLGVAVLMLLAFLTPWPAMAQIASCITVASGNTVCDLDLTPRGTLIAFSGTTIRRTSLATRPDRSTRRGEVQRPKAAVELAGEGAQVGVDDLLGDSDFLELAVIGWPSHPLRFGDVVADAAGRSELAPELESTSQSPVRVGLPAASDRRADTPGATRR